MASQGNDCPDNYLQGRIWAWLKHIFRARKIDICSGTADRMVILPTSRTPAHLRYSAHHRGTDDEVDTVVLIRLRCTASAITGRTRIGECEAWWKRGIDPTATGATTSGLVHFASEVVSP